MTNPNWNEFGQRRTQSASPPPADENFDDLCASALTGPSGQRFVDALRRRFIDRPENVFADERELRVRAAQAQLVRDLESARDRGLAAREARAKAAQKTA